MEAIEGHVWNRTEDATAKVEQGSAGWATIQGFAANNAKHPMADNLGLAFLRPHPTLATDALIMVTLVECSNSSASRKKKKRKRGKKNRGRIREADEMHYEWPDDPNFSPAYVNL